MFLAEADRQGLGAKLEEALAAIDAASTIEALQAVMTRLSAGIGYASYSYIDVRRLPISEEPVPFYRSTLPQDYLDTYLAENYLGYDPVVSRAATTNAAFTWSACPEYHEALRGRPGVRSRAIRVMETATDFGYTQGFLLPAHAVDQRGRPASALIALFWREDPKELERPELRPAWLKLAAAAFHEKMLELRGLNQSGPQELPSLTDRERECLVWACRGKTRADTADILGITERTVEFHFDRAMKKLGVHNKYHAIATAIQLGLIHP